MPEPIITRHLQRYSHTDRADMQSSNRLGFRQKERIGEYFYTVDTIPGIAYSTRKAARLAAANHPPRTAITQENDVSLNETQPKVDRCAADFALCMASWAVGCLRDSLLLEQAGFLHHANQSALFANAHARKCWESMGVHFNAPTPIHAVRLALAP